MVGIDKEQIRKIFQAKFGAQDETRGSSYVEKFIQLEFDLPPKTSEEVEAFMLENALTELKETPDTIKLISKFIERNPRKIKRWLNSVIFLEKLYTLEHKAKPGAEPSKLVINFDLASIWLFLKATFPRFSALISSKPLMFNDAIRLAKSGAEKEKVIEDFKLEKRLVDFLSSLKPEYKDNEIKELIHLSRLTPVLDLSEKDITFEITEKIRSASHTIENAKEKINLFLDIIAKRGVSNTIKNKKEISNYLEEFDFVLKKLGRVQNEVDQFNVEEVEQPEEQKQYQLNHFNQRISDLYRKFRISEESFWQSQIPLIEKLKEYPSDYQKFLEETPNQYQLYKSKIQ